MVREVFQGTVSCLPLHTVGPNLSIIKKSVGNQGFPYYNVSGQKLGVGDAFPFYFTQPIFHQFLNLLSSKPTLRIFSKSFVFALFLWSLSKKVISAQQCIVQPFSKNWHISAFFHFYVWAQKPILRKIKYENLLLVLLYVCLFSSSLILQLWATLATLSNSCNIKLFLQL